MWEAVQFLFPSFIACMTILVILGYMGIHVLEREIIFIDIALAQIAATGSTFAFILYRQHLTEENQYILRLFAVGFTLLAAVFFSYVSKKVVRISQETVIGVTYAIFAAAMLFLLATAAGSDIHMEEMLTGSILWAQWPEIFHCAVVFTFVGLFHYFFRDKFKGISRAYRDASDQGMNVMWWDFLFYSCMGIVITYTVEIAGVLLTFAFLIIPGVFSALFAQSWRIRLLIAWTLGVLTSVAGLAFSYRFDFSCGPSMVSIMGLVLIAVALVKYYLI